MEECRREEGKDEGRREVRNWTAEKIKKGQSTERKGGGWTKKK